MHNLKNFRFIRISLKNQSLKFETVNTIPQLQLFSVVVRYVSHQKTTKVSHLLSGPLVEDVDVVGVVVLLVPCKINK